MKDMNSVTQENSQNAWADQLKENKEDRYLAQALWQQGPALYQRFTHFYQQLHTLPRQWRRFIQRKVAPSIAAAALLLALGLPLPKPAYAANITVDGVTCTLVDAITAANTDTVTGGCNAGIGADTITLGTDVTLTAINNSIYGATGLPVVTSNITIEGGAHTISRDGAAPNFRILAVNNTGDLTLNDVTINGGATQTVGGYRVDRGGGAVLNYQGNLTIQGSTISGNAANQGGGGIYNYFSDTVAIQDSTISGNSASRGGGIADYFGTVMTVQNSMVSGNTANRVGGGIYTDGGNVSIQNSTINGNMVNDYGGGIYHWEGTMIIQDSTISGNTATNGDGGGIKNYDATLTVQNSTITGNSANRRGAGIYNGFAGEIILQNSLISGNSAGTVGSALELFNYYDGPGSSYNGVVNAGSYNIFGHSGIHNALAFSNFAPHGSDMVATLDGTDPTALGDILDSTLADNGGPTLTHALVTGSPAIELIPDGINGCDGTANGSTSLDQRGKPRAQGEAKGGTACDVGAFEYGSNPIIVDAVGACTLPDAITAANTDAAVGGCEAGNGADTIFLETDVTLDAVDNNTYENTGLPVVTSEITIEGGAHTISRESTAPNFRIFAVSGYDGNLGDLTLRDVTVSGGIAPRGGNGGGIYNYYGSLRVENATISGNEAWGYGGGIAALDGTAVIQDSIISGNSARNGGGGGLYSYCSTTVENSTINGNSVQYNGGGILVAGESLVVTSSTISGNTVGEDGGGIHNYGTVVLRNSTVSGNFANAGGGSISNATYSTLTMQNTTIYGNSAEYGGGIYNEGTLTLQNSLITGNTANSEANEIYHEYGVINLNNYNLLGHGGETDAQAFSGFTPCSGIGCTDFNATAENDNVPLTSIINPTLADNDGATFTHALPSGSPALERIVEGATGCGTAGFTMDQRGFARPGTKNDQINKMCEIGAWEAQAEDPTAITLKNFSSQSNNSTILPVLGGLLATLTSLTLVLRKRSNQAFQQRRKNRFTEQT